MCIIAILDQVDISFSKKEEQLKVEENRVLQLEQVAKETLLRAAKVRKCLYIRIIHKKQF